MSFSPGSPNIGNMVHPTLPLSSSRSVRDEDECSFCTKNNKSCGLVMQPWNCTSRRIIKVRQTQPHYRIFFRKGRASTAASLLHPHTRQTRLDLPLHSQINSLRIARRQISLSLSLFRKDIIKMQPTGLERTLFGVLCT